MCVSIHLSFISGTHTHTHGERMMSSAGRLVMVYYSLLVVNFLTFSSSSSIRKPIRYRRIAMAQRQTKRIHSNGSLNEATLFFIYNK